MGKASREGSGSEMQGSQGNLEGLWCLLCPSLQVTVRPFPGPGKSASFPSFLPAAFLSRLAEPSWSQPWVKGAGR